MAFDDKAETQEQLTSTFREKTISILTRIETNLVNLKESTDEFIKESREDRDELHKCVDKIPSMDKALENHLHTHDNMARYIFYPLSAATIIAALGAFFKLILHIF